MVGHRSIEVNNKKITIDIYYFIIKIYWNNLIVKKSVTPKNRKEMFKSISIIKVWLLIVKCFIYLFI